MLGFVSKSEPCEPYFGIPRKYGSFGMPLAAARKVGEKPAPPGIMGGLHVLGRHAMNRSSRCAWTASLRQSE